MTYPIETKFDLDEICDEILRYLYWRRYDDNEVDLDQAQIELPFPFEPFEIATQKLNLNGYIELNPTNSLLGKITQKGTVFVRTTSFVEETNNNNKANLKENLQNIKSILEVLFGLITICLTIYSIYITNKVSELENKLESIAVKQNTINK
ncbi:hypothetical protein [Cloacibacterium sp.]|uniref:hypothetical protein n=1 Tax=Cloacibacterium sp. TaxID=1913682 RepID=UPI0039E52A38